MGNLFTRSSPPTTQPSRPSGLDPLHSSPSMDAGEMYHEIDPVEQIKPNKRVKSYESMNPGHNGSTSSSPPTMEPSQSSPVDSVHSSSPMDATEMYCEIDPVQPTRPSKRVKTSESTNPGLHGSTSSFPFTMEPSQPSPLDSINTSPSMDASEIYGNIDPSEQIKPSKRLKAEHFQPSPVDSVHPSPSMDAIASITELYGLDQVEQIDPLVSFIENHLKKMKNPSEIESSSSDGWLETVQSGTKLAVKTIDTICTEAEKLPNSAAIRNVTLRVLEEVEDLHWAFIALSIAAYAVENYLSVGSTEKNECREVLLNILELAIDVNEHSKRMSYEREKLRDAVGTIVEGAVIFSDSLGNIFRFWSATTAADQFKKTNQQLRDARDSLALSSLKQILDFQWRKDYKGDKAVFLSHSGAQKNFVRQLYRDLKREHVSCFFDEDHSSLPLAQRFPPLIFKAAETCKIAVLLLSKEFVCSKWPMLELSAFIRAMKSGKNPNLSLLPIFFAITPKELCDISKHEWQNLGITSDTKDEWQVALQVLRSINGLTFVEAEDEVELRDKVRKKICCFLNRINPPQLLDFTPVGIDKQVREVKALLKMEDTQSALAVIIYGFGGVGKSTVAASVVQSLDWSSGDFKFCMVAIDEKTHNKTSHVIQLQKYIISKLGRVDPDFQNPFEGRIEIKKAMQNKCSLLLIDNVVDKDYVRDILPQDLQSSQQDTKLRIIITSRDKNVSAELNIICNEYEVKSLSYADSKKLLMDTIVGSRMIDVEENRMIDEVAFSCRGVPLLLSVFGKHLRVESKKDSYEEALDVLRKGNFDCYRDEDLSTKLMFVYDKIKDMDVKEAFLDICIYFHGWKWNLVADIVDSFKLEDLRRRTLVSKSGSGDVIVHEILRLMGMKEARLSRFSNYGEFSEALEDNLHGIGNVKGLSVGSDSDKCSIKITELEAKHQSLRVLMLGDWVTLEGSPSLKAFKNLRYLSVGDIAAFPFKDPSKLDKLRVLVNRSKPSMILSHLPSGLKHISQELPDVECDEFAKHPLQNLKSLKSFVVRKRKPVELPEELHLPSSLLDLQLIRCKKLPKDISHLSALESLILDRSDSEFLPQGYGNLNNLKHLSINYCSKLASLSEELGMLSSLETLSMEYCGNLRALSQRLGALHSLQTLKLGGCINLLLLPESFGALCISSLQLHSLVNLQELTNSFGNMPLLKDLSLVSCLSLLSLPNSFVQLKMLETLEISHCSKLSVLPQDFGRLSYLKDMSVSDCHLLKELPHGFGALRSLRTFKLENCSSFVNLPLDFTELICLEHLSLRMLPLISRIPDGCGKLKKLKYLSLFCCFQLKTLSSDFENMAALEELHICHCPELDGAMMEKILNLQNCYTADIEGSRNLVEKLKQMEREIEHPIAVFSALNLKDEENEERSLRQALLHGKFMEVGNCTDQFMERSSLFGGLEEGTIATVALIMLPTDMQAHQHQTLQRFVEMAREKAKTKGSGKLEIVCARKFERTVQRSTPTEEEERAEEESIRRILLSLRKGSCAIPSKSRSVKILSALFARHWNVASLTLDFLMADVIDMEGTRSFENLKFINERKMRPKKEQSHNSIQNFVDSICGEDEDDWETDEAGDVGRQCQCHYQSVAGQSRVREFIDALKGNGIHHLLIDNNTRKGDG